MADDAAQAPSSLPSKQRNRPRPDADYEVGYCKPPREHCWRPGQSGNPRGRPKGVSVVKSLIQLLETVVDHQGTKMRAAEVVAAKLIDAATKGNKQSVHAIRTILERVDGPVRTEITGLDGGPLFLAKAFGGVDAQLAAQGTLSAMSATDIPALAPPDG